MSFLRMNAFCLRVCQCVCASLGAPGGIFHLLGIQKLCLTPREASDAETHA